MIRRTNPPTAAIPQTPTKRVTLPSAYLPLLSKDNRYRFFIYFGGRGSGKSWSFARALIIKAYSERHRVLCCREFQRSIADSVHKLLTDTIATLGLSDYFVITNDRITSKTTGSEIIFRGLHANAESIKSLEGITLVWIEEGQSITAESLDYLIPTIRTESSEIWISFNPRDEQDEIYRRFILNTPDNALVVKVNYDANPYFPDVLRDQMIRDRETNYDRYRNVWLGEPLVISDAVIFAGKWQVRDFVAPADAEYMYGADFGFSSDPSTLIRCFVREEDGQRNLYIDFEAWGLHISMEQYPALYDTVPQSRDYPINADNARPETIDYIRRHGFPLITGEAKQRIEDGLAYILSYNHIYIHTRCTHTIEEFRLYSYKLDGSGRPTRIPEDRHNHCSDALRYSLVRKIRGRAARIVSDYITPGTSSLLGNMSFNDNSFDF